MPPRERAQHGFGKLLENTAAALNGHPRAMMVAVGILFTASAYVLAGVRLFWFDEFITIYIARQGSLGAIWHLLSLGADPNPPLSHALVLASSRLLGNNELAIRTPFVLASVLGVLCIYEFLTKYVAPVFAASGVFFFMTTHAFDYAFEARSYSLLLCFGMLSLLAWRWSGEPACRRWALPLMAASLALGVSSNYYGVLAFFPIAAGEIAYTLTIPGRRVRIATWLWMAAASCVLIPYLPLIRISTARFTPYAWNKPNSDFLAFTYSFILEDVWWLAAAVLFGVALVWVYERTQLHKWRPTRFPLHELVAIAFLVAYPALGYGIAVLRAGMISPRFVIPFVSGLSIAVAAAGARLFGRSAATSLMFFACCLCWCLTSVGVNIADYYGQRSTMMGLIHQLPKSGTLVIPDSLLVLPIHYYAPSQAAARMVMPVDLPHVRKYKREDSAEQNLSADSRIYPVPQVPLAQLLRNTPDFYIVAPWENWLLHVLWDYGHPVDPLPAQTNNHNLKGFFSLSFGDCLVFREHFRERALD